MATLQSTMFQNEFSLTAGGIVCNDLQSANAILSDVEGFIAKHNLGIKITKHDTFTIVSGKGVISSESVILINNYGLTKVNTYYSETETLDKEISWQNLRRMLITMINCD